VIIPSHYRCDRCGVKMDYAEFILKKNSHESNGSYGDGYIIVGAYCKICGYLINEAANISTVEKC